MWPAKHPPPNPLQTTNQTLSRVTSIEDDCRDGIFDVGWKTDTSMPSWSISQLRTCTAATAAGIQLQVRKW